MKDYFQFTRVQKIGVVALSGIILLLIVLLNVNQHRGLEESPLENTAQFEMVHLDSAVTEELMIQDPDANSSDEPTLFNFDPNTLDPRGWEKLGFSGKQALAIIKYRDSYGPFEKPEDVAKIYVVSEEKYAEIKPFMVFDESTPSEIAASQININMATQKDLEAIYGIGPYFAKKTIAYRDALGGFVSKDQYEEIDGLSLDGLKALSDNTTLGFGSVVRIKINSASKEELRSHPYLNDWAVVTDIISQRDKQRLESFEVFAKNGTLSEEEIKKLSPYIDFE